jgi:hypothetical protein
MGDIRGARRFAEDRDVVAVAAEPATSLMAPGAKVELLADGFKFTEGPAVDKAGNVYFTDQPNDRIMKWSVEETLSTFLQPCGRSNGLYFDRDGNLLACADELVEGSGALYAPVVIAPEIPAKIRALLERTAVDPLAIDDVLLGIDGNRPVTIARLVRECWTSDLRDRFLSCTLTMHDDNSLTDSIESLKAGRAYFLSQGFSVEEVFLAHVFIDSSM